MRIMLKPLLASLAVSTLIGGCAIKPHTQELKYAPLQKQQRSIVAESAATYMREVTPEEESLKAKISYVGTTTLIDALREQLPSLNIMPADTNVDLLKEISIYANRMPLEDYLEYISALTGYDIALSGNIVTVSSFVEKQWNLAVFSSTRNVSLKAGEVIGGGGGGGSSDDSDSSGGGGGGNTVTTSSSVDEWETIIEGAKSIIMTSGADEDKNEMAPYVQSLRSIGTVSAGGSPRKIDAVDQFVRNAVKQGSRQVNISVQAFDVILDDSRASGINWEELSFSKIVDGNPLDIVFNSNSGSVFTDTLPMTTGTTYGGSKVNASFMMNFLNQFGEVELLNQPNITARNGVYAYISTGEELSYVGKVERETSLNSALNSADVLSFEVESVRVGVTLAVVPRILDDDRVLLDIWPVVSSKTGDFLIGDIKIPNLALHDMSTQVIVKSGQAIQLGGFIRRSIAKKLQELPWREKITGMLVNPLFESESNVLERRELVLTVTPTIIDEI